MLKNNKDRLLMVKGMLFQVGKPSAFVRNFEIQTKISEKENH